MTQWLSLPTNFWWHVVTLTRKIQVHYFSHLDFLYLSLIHSGWWLMVQQTHFSMDWFKGKSTGNHGFYHQIWGFPVNFPIIQFYELQYSHEIAMPSWQDSNFFCALRWFWHPDWKTGSTRFYESTSLMSLDSHDQVAISGNENSLSRSHMTQRVVSFDLLVLSREWMGMGEWDDYW